MAALVNSTSVTARVATQAIVGAGCETVSGITSRFVSTMISSGGNVEASASSAFDVHNIVFDFALGSVMGGAQGIKEPPLKKLKQSNTVIEPEKVSGEDWCRYFREKYGNENVVWENGTPAQQARSWQGMGKYTGIDEYTDITISGGMIVINIENGQIKIGENIIVLPGYKFDEFKQTSFYNGQDGIKIIYLRQPQNIGGNRFIVELFFKDGIIYSVSLICIEKDFSEKNEPERKLLHDKILESHNIDVRKNYSWGKIASEYNPRGNVSSINVYYDSKS